MSRWLIWLLCGCGPSQFVVHVDTNAPLPPRLGAAVDPLRPPALFDELRVEVLRGVEQLSQHDFPVDEGLFQDGRVSFGVAPPFGAADLVVRLRLFRGDHAIDGEPDPGATLETDVALPPLDDSGGTLDLVVRLLVDNVGQPQMEAATHGTVDTSQVGSWPGARVIPCATAPGPGEACVPGGAFWMGDPQFRDPNPDIDVHHERLVVVSPFFIDTHEVTVADARAQSYKPVLWSTSGDPNVYDYWCTYTTGPSAADPGDTHGAMAANCMAFEYAGPYCRRLGKDLPSEAQFEFAASGRGLEQAFVWGNDEPTCDDAVWGWGGGGQTLGYDSQCRTNNDAIGVRAPGSGRRDRVLFDGVEVVDLAGNVSEWTRDRWSLPSEGFWSRPGVFVDPVADATSSDGAHLHSVRGGAFHDPPLLLRAAYRLPAPDNALTVFYKVGWRCARPGM